MVSTERVYNPQIAAPENVLDARIFADAFDGKRLPDNHPLNFHALGIEFGWTPWGHLTDDSAYGEYFGIPSVALWGRLRVPGFPIRVMDGSIDNPDYRLLRRKLLTVDMGEIMRASRVADVTRFVVLRDNRWTASVLITEDLYKPDSVLREELHALAERKHPSPTTKRKIVMKHAVLYVFGGLPD